ncbi:hypothetical protein NLI96_g7681 [Meripilus lineatus]|uniref:Wax synthase domain-containing protein n=1 Tax=Meripilus lineatus TaxID=2056292 RepID=A0AAD5UYP8_9APHY|nr:hypothetical protein NLI96_g7681 [Physisporinus lineatus]
MEKVPFLLATAKTAVVHWCLLDLVLSTLARLPGIGTPPGGSIYYPHLSPFPRHLLAFALTTFAGGFGLLSSMIMEYAALSVFAVAVLGHSPTSWPPLFDNPWASTSVHDFWARRWHQGLRRTFLVLGGYPGQWIAGRAGLIIGTFLASGLYHEWSMYLVNRGVDHRVTLFFAVQPIGLFIEKAFTRFTGRKVSGPFGWIWTFLFVVGTGQLCIDSWLTRGLAASPPIIPYSLSPCRGIIFPIFEKQIDNIVSILKV